MLSRFSKYNLADYCRRKSSTQHFKTGNADSSNPREPSAVIFGSTPSCDAEHFSKSSGRHRNGIGSSRSRGVCRFLRPGRRCIHIRPPSAHRPCNIICRAVRIRGHIVCRLPRGCPTRAATQSTLLAHLQPHSYRKRPEKKEQGKTGG